MKKYILDQSIFLVLGIAIMAFIPIICGPFFSLVFEVVAILCWGYLCRRILLLPVDLVLGKGTQTAYFATQSAIEDLEFFKNTYFCEWKFIIEKGQTLRLLVPIAISPKEAYKLVPPQKDVIHRITYFRLSKILLDWDQG